MTQHDDKSGHVPLHHSLRSKHIGNWALGAAAFLGLVLWATDDTVTYRIDDWCLSYERSTVTYDTDNPAANRPIPFFLAPSDFPTSSKLDDPDATGLSVRYSKWRSGPFLAPDIDACGGVAYGDGLIVFPETRMAAQRRRPGCPFTQFHDILMPVAADPEHLRIRIQCSAAPSCTMSDRMPNGWEASIALPRRHLDQWQQASRIARNYFAAFMTDCGTSG